MNKIIFATTNQGKIKEISAILSDLKIKIVSSNDLGITKEIVEDKKTLKGNAVKKASYVNGIMADWVMADDSGIFIDALDGQPGVKSSRWAGKSDIQEYTLKKLKKTPKDKRGANFQTAIVLISPKGKCRVFSGKVDGKIASKPAGASRQSLPYDTIFIPNGYEKTVAEMPRKQKNQISHRALALKKLKTFIKTQIKQN